MSIIFFNWDSKHEYQIHDFGVSLTIFPTPACPLDVKIKLHLPFPGVHAFTLHKVCKWGCWDASAVKASGNLSSTLGVPQSCLLTSTCPPIHRYQAHTSTSIRSKIHKQKMCYVINSQFSARSLQRIARQFQSSCSGIARPITMKGNKASKLTTQLQKNHASIN